MLVNVIDGWNAAPGAPAGWDPAKSGECAALPIRVLTGEGNTGVYCESAWEPTPRELADLAAGGQIVLRVYGWQVPVSLYVEPPHDPVPGSKQ